MEIVFNHNYTAIQNVNAMARMIIYWTLISSAIIRRPIVLVVGASALLFLSMQQAREEKAYLLDDQYANALSYCQKPSTDNPLANVLPSDYGNGMKLPACVSSTVTKEIRHELDNQEITGPVYELLGTDANARAARRQFYSMPSTTVPNERDGFIHALYGKQMRRERA
jgi:hypothetical protein